MERRKPNPYPDGEESQPATQPASARRPPGNHRSTAVAIEDEEPRGRWRARFHRWTKNAAFLVRLGLGLGVGWTHRRIPRKKS